MGIDENQADGPLLERLTRREREILALLAQGLTAPEIAEKLTLAVSSVKWHVQQLYGKLGVNSKLQAIKRARALGLLEGAPDAGRSQPGSPAGGAAAPRHNLPFQLTSFVGREREIEEIQRLLSTARLVTLTGAGGSGKTRLALQVGFGAQTAYPEGVWLVDLAPLSNAELVPQKLGSVVGVREEPGRPPIATLTDYFQSKKLLVIFDNCEHLIEACAQLAEGLVSACPNLSILATSREALAIPGETVFLLPALVFPDLRGLSNAASGQLLADTLGEYEAVQLFVERATGVLPAFRLTPDNALAVAQVCQQLDGIPLAIELAAARVKLLSVGQIAERLDDRFNLLTTGSRTALPRHQTLRALIDWSHDLLPAQEQLLLRRLAAFNGSFTLSAVTTVCAGDGIESDLVLDLLSHLADKSLVVVETGQPMGLPRYRLLETIRQYALDKLQAAYEVTQVQRRHAEFFMGLAEEAEAGLRSRDSVAWMRRLEAERDNLRMALDWSRAGAGAAEIFERLASALHVFWLRSNDRSEGRRWLAEALAREPVTDPTVRAKSLYAAGLLAAYVRNEPGADSLLEESVRLWRSFGIGGEAGLAYTLAAQTLASRSSGKPATARILGEEAVAIFRARDDRWGLAFALAHLSMAIRDQEDYSLAASKLEESLALWRALGDTWGLGLALSFSGLLAVRQGDYETALDRHTEALALAKAGGDENDVSWSLQELGLVCLNLGDEVRAASYFKESLRRTRDMGNRYGIAYNLLYLGIVALYDGDKALAQSNVTQALDLSREVGPLWFRGDCLKGMAAIAAVDGHARRAARLWGAAEAQLTAVASYMDNSDRILFERTLAASRASLGEAAFEAARAEGRALTTEQALDYASAVSTDE